MYINRFTVSLKLWFLCWACFMHLSMWSLIWVFSFKMIFSYTDSLYASFTFHSEKDTHAILKWHCIVAIAFFYLLVFSETVLWNISQTTSAVDTDCYVCLIMSSLSQEAFYTNLYCDSCWTLLWSDCLTSFACAIL